MENMLKDQNKFHTHAQNCIPKGWSSVCLINRRKIGITEVDKQEDFRG